MTRAWKYVLTSASVVWNGAGRALYRFSWQDVGAILALCVLCVALGFASVVMGDMARVRPVFFVVLPMVIAVGLAFAISPKALVLAVFMVRGGADQIFQGTQVGGGPGLGALINLAVILLAVVLHIKDRAILPRRAVIAWLPFLGIIFVGVAYSPDFVPALRFAFALASTFAVFVIAFHLVEDIQSLDRLLKIILLSSVPVVVLTFLDIAQGRSAYSLEGMETTVGRYGGPFPHPNILGFYAVLILGILLYLWKRKGGGQGGVRRTAVYVAYTLLMLIILYVTKTRSAWMGAVLMYFLYGFFVERRYLIYLALLPFVALLIPDIRDRIADLGQGNEVVQYARLNSFAWRKLLWENALDWMSPIRYIFGYGTAAFYWYSIEFFQLAGGIRWGAHSVWVQLFFELGVIGFSAFVWLFYQVAKMVWPLWRGGRGGAVIFLSQLFTYVVVSASDNMLSYLVYNWYFWLAIGGISSVVARSNVAVLK